MPTKRGRTAANDLKLQEARPSKKRPTAIEEEKEEDVEKVTTGKKIKRGRKGKTTTDDNKQTRNIKSSKTADKSLPTTNLKSRQKRPTNRKGTNVTAIERSISHHSLSCEPGKILVMGQGDFGQLGLGDSMTERKKPFPVKGEIQDMEIIQVECGGMHTVALTSNGKVYSWGCNDEGALGYTISDGESFTPLQVKVLNEYKVVQISAGDCHSTALLDNGHVYCWGTFRDSNGPFAIPGSAPSSEPRLVYNDTSNPAVKVVSGDNHVMILTNNGDVHTFGSGEQGQLGRIAEIHSSRGGRLGLTAFIIPQRVRIRKLRSVANPVFRDIFAGSYTSFAVAQEKNSVYVWGLNNYCQLGVDSAGRESVFIPMKVPEDWLWSWVSNSSSTASSSDNPLSVSGAIHHSLICTTGMIYSVGNDNYGRLGLGKVKSETKTPTQVTAIPDQDIVKVSCNGSCSFAVSESGTAYSWGMGSTLQLGHADEEDNWEPVKISGKNLEGKKVLNISCGGQHTALLVAADVD